MFIGLSSREAEMKTKTLRDNGLKPCPLRTPERKARISEWAEKMGGQLSRRHMIVEGGHICVK